MRWKYRLPYCALCSLHNVWQDIKQKAPKKKIESCFSVEKLKRLGCSNQTEGLHDFMCHVLSAECNWKPFSFLEREQKEKIAIKLKPLNPELFLTSLLDSKQGSWVNHFLLERKRWTESSDPQVISTRILGNCDHYVNLMLV